MRILRHALPLAESRSRRRFLADAVCTVGAAAAGSALAAMAAPLGALEPRRARAVARARRFFEFTFARLRYDSGDWDYNPKVCANLLDAVMQYTDIPVNQREIVITADSAELSAFPFLFMTGHKLVRFSEAERRGLVRYVENGGLLFSDDCNHDVNGLYAKTFEAEMVKAFGPNPMPKLAKRHALYTSFFDFPDGPPRTSHELNGWGDNIVHDYLRGVERNGRVGVLYSNKDYGCEWDYDWKNKRFRRRDNARFAVNIVVYAMT
jgi:hypothetical protein